MNHAWLRAQHRQWRSQAIAAWLRAGIGTGHTVIDLGAGLGQDSALLAAMVGTSGRVIAVERDEELATGIGHATSQLGLTQVEVRHEDMDDLAWPPESVDIISARFVLTFSRDPQQLLARLARSLRPGGTLISHEYTGAEDEIRAWLSACGLSVTSATFRQPDGPSMAEAAAHRPGAAAGHRPGAAAGHRPRSTD